MMKLVVVFACCLALAHGGGYTSIIGQSKLVEPIKIQRYISPAPIIKTPLLLPKIEVAPVYISKPLVTVAKAPIVIPKLAPAPILKALPVSVGWDKGDLGWGNGDLGWGKGDLGW